MSSTTLASLMQNDLVPMAALVERHDSAATIAEVLLGIVPNTGKYLEAWPPANRTYYVIVPNFLNISSFMFDLGAPKNLVSLALYVSSLGADCPYCTSHTCTFAIRRGVPANKLTLEVLSSRDQTLFTSVEQSVVDVAEHLGHMPSTLTPEM